MGDISGTRVFKVFQSWRRILKWVESGEKEERRADLSRTYLHEVGLHDAIVNPRKV